VRNWRELDYRELPWGAKPLRTGGREHTHPPTYLFYLLLYISSVPELAENKIEAGTDPGSLPVPDPSRIRPGSVPDFVAGTNLYP